LLKILKWHNSPKSRLIFWSTIVFLMLIFAVIGPLFIKHDPYLVDLSQVNQPPNAEFIMGTDYLGRCIFCRLVVGATRSIYAAVLVVVITFTTGSTIGILCGYFGGFLDSVLMRITDAVLAFPSLVFTIAVAGMLGGGMTNCIIAMTAIGWTGYARLARSQVLSVKEKTYVSAARVTGASTAVILFKTVLPNVLNPLVVSASMHVGNTILSFAGLSYIGLGTAPPYPEWGTMLNDAKAKLQQAPWGVLFPGLAILLVVMTLGMFSDSLNEKMNPKKQS
jgi:peptide/nickel transport system permease protein